MPALDGVRAFAVLGVMAYHGGVSFLPAGFFGVDAFFVLSGFLITTLLVTEWGQSNGIALRAFWARRARRLLPALFVVLVFVALYARFVATPGMYPGLRGDGFAALFYYANWHFIATSQNYFVQTGPSSPLLHTWSLAIEEQFYVVWPLVILGLLRWRGRRHDGLQAVLVVSVVGVLASASAMALLFDPGADPTRVYFGTDTHAQSLLVGAALAAGVALWRRRGAAAVSSRHARSALTTAGVLGVAVCAWTWSQWQYGQATVFRGGFLIVGASVAAVILSAVLHPTGVVARALSWAPLRYLGMISYGMYLWHFPLDIALDGDEHRAERHAALPGSHRGDHRRGCGLVPLARTPRPAGQGPDQGAGPARHAGRGGGHCRDPRGHDHVRGGSRIVTTAHRGSGGALAHGNAAGRTTGGECSGAGDGGGRLGGAVAVGRTHEPTGALSHHPG